MRKAFRASSENLREDFDSGFVDGFLLNPAHSLRVAELFA
jgi:hypothetical protein